MSLEELEKLAGQMASIDQRELVFVLSKILPEFIPFDCEPGINRSGFFLGVFRELDGDIDIAIVAYPDSEAYGSGELGPDWGLCQSRSCEFSCIEYISNFKQCLSPISKEKICLT